MALHVHWQSHFDMSKLKITILYDCYVPGLIFNDVCGESLAFGTNVCPHGLTPLLPEICT
jgi:hypothetical protein